MSLKVYRKERVEVLEESGTLSKIRTENAEFWVKTYVLKSANAPHFSRSLVIMSPPDRTLDAFMKFIDYLRTPAAQTKLHLEAKCPEMDYAVRDQYRKLTGGAELVEGEGYHVAPSHSRKTGCEGYVTFVVPEFIPDEVRVLMVQRPGLINKISFVWLLIEQGFRCSR